MSSLPNIYWEGYFLRVMTIDLPMDEMEVNLICGMN